MAVPQPSSSSAPGPLTCLSATSDFSHLAVLSDHNAVYLTTLPSASVSSPSTSTPANSPVPVSLPLPSSRYLSSTSSTSTTATPSPSSSKALTSLSFPDPSCLYVCDVKGALTRYDPSQFFTHPGTSTPVPKPKFSIPAAHSGTELTCVAALSARSHVLTGGKDGIVRSWDASTSKSVAKLTGHRYDVRALALAYSSSPADPTVAASAGRDRTVRLWDLKSNSLIATLEGHSGWVHDVAIVPGGNNDPDPVVASASGDKTVRLWDLRTMKERRTFKGHQYRIWAVDVAAESQRRFAASASTDATVRLWDLSESASGKLSKGEEGDGAEVILEGHTDSVLSVIVRKDGGLIVSACEDGSLYTWDGNACMKRKEADTVSTPVEQQQESLIDLDTSYSSITTTTASNISAYSNSNHLPLSSGSRIQSIPKHVDLLTNNAPQTQTPKPDQDPGYDKSAAELMRALKRIQQLETSLKDAERRAAEGQRAVSALRTEVARRDDTVRKLQSEVETMKKLESAVQVQNLLQAERRKTDVRLVVEGDENVNLNRIEEDENEFTEPVNKIGAVSDQLSKLAARLDAMIATS